MYLLPLRREGAYFQMTVELEGKSYGFSFRWNGRIGVWIMDVFNGNGDVLIRGLRCFINVPMTARFGLLEQLFTGDLFFFDSTSENKEAGFDDFGDRVVLYYVTAEEIAQLAAEQAA